MVKLSESNSSILSAIQKLRLLLTREEKIKWCWIVGFALCTSLLEVITALTIVVFAQVLNQPEVGRKYINMLGWHTALEPAQIIFYIALSCGLIYFIKNFVAALEVFHQNFAIQKMSYHFKNKLLHRYAEADYSFYLTRNSATGISVIANDTEQMFSSGMTSLASTLSEGIVFLGLITTVIAIKPSLALVIFGIGSILGLLVSKSLFPLFYRWGQKLQHALLFSSQNLQQFFHGFKEIVLLGKRDAFVNAYRLHSRRRSKTYAMQMATNTMPRMIIEVLFVAFFVATISYLCFRYENPQQMTGILAGYLYTGFRLMPGLNRIIGQLNTFKLTIPSIDRVYQEYNTVTNKESYLDIPDLHFEKIISLQAITFHYPNTNKNVLSHIKLDIYKGECLGIVGETGSGKSTLVDVILGLLRPQQGSVLIDGKYPANSYQWHQRIGYVPQAIYLLDDTIEANIAFGEKPEEITVERLQQAIHAAQLQQFIADLPRGLQTLVGERGIRLSGGERQRIAIARALYRNPEVLIFDEATSALDNETESQLMSTIQTISKNRTVIMVAHRLTTLKNSDRIIEMKNGRINRVINYSELQQNKKTDHVY